MDLKAGKRFLSLAYKVFVEKSNRPEQIPYYPQKTVSFAGKKTDAYYPRAIPETLGVSSFYLTSYLADLERGKNVNVNSVYVLADGKNILDASAPGYDSGIWHITHSMAKTVIGLGIGLLYDEGKVSPEERVADIFPEYASALRGKAKNLTLHDLLSMGVSVGFSEVGSLIDVNWLAAYFSAAMKNDEDTFAYNSMTTYVLSSVIERRAGEKTDSYLSRKLFAPLGIENFFFEKSPSGTVKGGWGLYISPKDMAKLGMLVLDRGMFAGQRVISENWIRRMTAVQNKPSDNFGSYSYGYQVWVDPIRGNVLFNGMLGQDILVIPKERMVVVLTAGNSELFQHSEMLQITEKYFVNTFTRAPVPITEKKGDYEKLLFAEKHFYRNRAFIRPPVAPGGVKGFFRKLLRKSELPLSHEAARLDGKAFAFPKNNIGILPLFVSLMQNNYGGGIREIFFRADTIRDRLYMYVDEGETRHRMEVGLGAPAMTELEINGEKYLVALTGAFAENEDGEKLLKLSFVFPELAGERDVKFFYEGEYPRYITRETPGYAIAEPYIDKLEKNTKGILGFFVSHIPTDVLRDKVRGSFSPSFTLTPVHECIPPSLPAYTTETPSLPWYRTLFGRRATAEEKTVTPLICASDKDEDAPALLPGKETEEPAPSPLPLPDTEDDFGDTAAKPADSSTSADAGDDTEDDRQYTMDLVLSADIHAPSSDNDSENNNDNL